MNTQVLANIILDADMSQYAQNYKDYTCPGTTSPAIFMQQILFGSYYISITLMASLWVNMAGKVAPGP